MHEACGRLSAVEQPAVRPTRAPRVGLTQARVEGAQHDGSGILGRRQRAAAHQPHVRCSQHRGGIGGGLGGGGGGTSGGGGGWSGGGGGATKAQTVTL